MSMRSPSSICRVAWRNASRGLLVFDSVARACAEAAALQPAVLPLAAFIALVLAPECGQLLAAKPSIAVDSGCGIR